MVDDSVEATAAVGGLRTTTAQKRLLANSSLEFNVDPAKNRKADAYRRLFPDLARRASQRKKLVRQQPNKSSHSEDLQHWIKAHALAIITIFLLIFSVLLSFTV